MESFSSASYSKWDDDHAWSDTIQRKLSQGVINDLDHVDFIPSDVNSSHQEALLKMFED